METDETGGAGSGRGVESGVSNGPCRRKSRHDTLVVSLVAHLILRLGGNSLHREKYLTGRYKRLCDPRGDLLPAPGRTAPHDRFVHMRT